jgi:hypothetical protein
MAGQLEDEPEVAREVPLGDREAGGEEPRKSGRLRPRATNDSIEKR